MRFITFTVIFILAASAHAGVVEYTDKEAWENAVPSFHTIDFTGFEHGTPLTDQYYDEFGLTFVGINNIVHTPSFPNDGQGVRGQPGSRIFFDTPMRWIAVDFPGNIVFNLYYQGELIYTSSEFWAFQSRFAGLISEAPFDEVYLFRETAGGLVFYDDLYFGIPAPGALGLLGLTALGARRRRRSF